MKKNTSHTAMKHILMHPRLLAIGLCLVALPALSQWVWTNQDGRKVFSDRPPPIDVPEQNILRRPGNAPAPTSDEGLDAPAEGHASAPVPKPAASKASGVDPTLAARKAKVEQAQALQQRAEEERLAQARARNCARAREARVMLTTGTRLTRRNAQGEKVFLDDAARTQELSHIDSVIASECK